MTADSSVMLPWSAMTVLKVVQQRIGNWTDDLQFVITTLTVTGFSGLMTYMLKRVKAQVDTD